MRSLALVVLTGLVPGIWVAATVYFADLIGHAVPVAWCVVGVVGLSLVLLTRPVCRAARFLVRRWTGTEVPADYRPLAPVTRMATGYWWNGYDYQRLRSVSVIQRWVQARVQDPASWRDMVWILVAPLTVGVAAALPVALVAAGAVGVSAPTSLRLPGPGTFQAPLALSSIALGVLLLPVGWRAVVPVARRLLGPSPLARLTTRVAALVQDRADLTQAQEAELHRIERDLHDGAQARLVSIGLSIGAVERLMDTDPDRAKALLRQTRQSSAVALGELRELARGIAPPVLLERGLVDAIRAVALDAPVPTVVHSTLDRRLETPIESALYFATVELLANAVKHAQASAIDITVAPTRNGVAISVADDGRGGARLGAGSGLTGIESRLHPFDGTLRIDSPPGGPTRSTVEVPCASS